MRLMKHEYFNNLNCIVSYQIFIAYEVFLITRIHYKHSNKLALNPSVQNLFEVISNKSIQVMLVWHRWHIQPFKLNKTGGKYLWLVRKLLVIAVNWNALEFFNKYSPYEPHVFCWYDGGMENSTWHCSNISVSFSANIQLLIKFPII